MVTFEEAKKDTSLIQSKDEQGNIIFKSKPKTFVSRISRGKVTARSTFTAKTFIFDPKGTLIRREQQKVFQKSTSGSGDQKRFAVFNPLTQELKESSSGRNIFIKKKGSPQKFFKTVTDERGTRKVRIEDPKITKQKEIGRQERQKELKEEFAPLLKFSEQAREQRFTRTVDGEDLTHQQFQKRIFDERQRGGELIDSTGSTIIKTSPGFSQKFAELRPEIVKITQEQRQEEQIKSVLSNIAAASSETPAPGKGKFGQVTTRTDKRERSIFGSDITTEPTPEQAAAFSKKLELGREKFVASKTTEKFIPDLSSKQFTQKLDNLTKSLEKTPQSVEILSKVSTPFITSPRQIGTAIEIGGSAAQTITKKLRTQPIKTSQEFAAGGLFGVGSTLLSASAPVVTSSLQVGLGGVFAGVGAVRVATTEKGKRKKEIGKILGESAPFLAGAGISTTTLKKLPSTEIKLQTQKTQTALKEIKTIQLGKKLTKTESEIKLKKIRGITEKEIFKLPKSSERVDLFTVQPGAKLKGISIDGGTLIVSKTKSDLFLPLGKGGKGGFVSISKDIKAGTILSKRVSKDGKVLFSKKEKIDFDLFKKEPTMKSTTKKDLIDVTAPGKLVKQTKKISVRQKELKQFDILKERSTKVFETQKITSSTLIKANRPTELTQILRPGVKNKIDSKFGNLPKLKLSQGKDSLSSNVKKITILDEKIIKKIKLSSDVSGEFGTKIKTDQRIIFTEKLSAKKILSRGKLVKTLLKSKRGQKSIGITETIKVPKLKTRIPGSKLSPKITVSELLKVPISSTKPIIFIKPKSKIKSKESSISSTKDIFKEVPSLISIPKLKTPSKQKEELITTPITKQSKIQTPITQQLFIPTPTSPTKFNFDTPPPPIVPPPSDIITPSRLPSFGGGFFSSSAIGGTVKPPKETFLPSLKALILNIKGTKPEFSTGLGIRPIIIKRKKNVRNKKKSRRRKRK